MTAMLPSSLCLCSRPCSRPRWNTKIWSSFSRPTKSPTVRTFSSTWTNLETLLEPLLKWSVWTLEPATTRWSSWRPPKEEDWLLSSNRTVLRRRDSWMIFREFMTMDFRSSGSVLSWSSAIKLVMFQRNFRLIFLKIKSMRSESILGSIREGSIWRFLCCLECSWWMSVLLKCSRMSSGEHRCPWLDRVTSRLTVVISYHLRGLLSAWSDCHQPVTISRQSSPFKRFSLRKILSLQTSKPSLASVALSVALQSKKNSYNHL